MTGAHVSPMSYMLMFPVHLCVFSPLFVYSPIVIEYPQLTIPYHSLFTHHAFPHNNLARPEA